MLKLNLVLATAILLGLCGMAGAYAQAERHIGPNLQSQFNHLPNGVIGLHRSTKKLTSLAKRALVAKALRVNLKSVGLTKPTVIHPSRNENLKHNTFWSKIEAGRGSILFEEGKIVFRGPVKYQLTLKAPLFDNSIQYYLVEVEILHRKGYWWGCGGQEFDTNFLEIKFVFGFDSVTYTGQPTVKSSEVSWHLNDVWETHGCGHHNFSLVSFNHVIDANRPETEMFVQYEPVTRAGGFFARWELERMTITPLRILP